MTVKRGLLLLALAALVVAACGGEQQQVQEQVPVTLRLGIFASSLSEEPALAQAVERFQEENPHITVDVEARFYPDPRSIERLEMDAFLWTPDPMLVEGEEPLVANLEPFVVEMEGFDEEEFFLDILDTFRWHGELYGLPADVDVVVMYYNRDLFDAQGVPYPQAGWTWQDFLDTAHQLTTIAGEGENQTGHWGFISSPWEGDVFLFALQHGGRLLDDPLRPTRPVFDPLVAEAVQWFADLALVHGVMPNSQTAPPDPLSAQGGFAMRQAAMVIGGVSQRDGADTPLSWDFGWGAVPLPRDAAPVSGMGARGYFIAAQSAQPQEAWALVRFLSASEPDLIPARREMAESESFRQRVGEELADAALTTLDEYDLFSFSAGAGMLDQRFANWIISFARRSWEVVDGDITAEEMMDRLAEEYADW